MEANGDTALSGTNHGWIGFEDIIERSPTSPFVDNNLGSTISDHR